MTTGPMSAYEQVVLDSEDEEMHDSKLVTVYKGLWDKKFFGTVKNSRMKFHKRHLGPTSPSEQAEKGTANTCVHSFGKSVTGDKETSTDAESSDNNNHLHLSTTLSQIPSPEIGDLTQDDALGYVDRYLSVSKVELSPGICHRKASREKSPPLISARGAQNLAKKIQVQTHHEEKRPFEWVDAGRMDRGADIFHKTIVASSNCGVWGQTYTRRKHKSGYPENRGTCSAGDGCEEKLAQGLGTVAENNSSMKELDVQSDAAGKNIDAYSGVGHTEDTCDIGLDTQVAAEAMEALAYLPPPAGRCTRITSSKERKRNNDSVDGGIVRSKKKRTGLTANPFKLVRDAEHIETPLSLLGIATKNSLNCQVQVCPQLSTSSSFSSLNSWHYQKGPRGKRKCPNVRSYPDAPRNWGTQSTIVNGNESDIISMANGRIQGNVEGEDNENEACLPNIHLLSSAKRIGARTISEGRKVSNANATCYKHHKRPIDKNLPKSYLLKELIRLGVSEHATDLIGKKLRQRKDTSYVRVLLSQHLDESIIKQQKKILARMNVSIASGPIEATHFVADKFTRTKNMLETMALGKLVVTHLWLESCGQANCLVDEKNYILRDVKKEKEMGFSMPVSLARARRQPLLTGRSVFITPRVKPDNKVITSLVTAAHGQLVDECQIYTGKNDEMLDNVLIISCEDDFEVCCPFLQRGITVCSSELLLSGIVTQKLELERHQLFAYQVARKSQDTSSRRFGKVYRRRRKLFVDHS
ncbi:uncharacterized protein LOC129309319 isoform X2 [Prosopis cineraria]|uniref:uncharacterized protein LOC129309319 isoform X2 n=1 Tax=Prosopis cineraria TaxID=364024 RepID=UPI00241002D4|nr:uncharacterized protein LOC129309319 isoform X2 [Prosopis cineraria]